MSLYKLSSNYMKKPWGNEKWLLSCHPSALSYIDNGKNGENQTIFEQLKNENIYQNTEAFPLLVKILSADKSLSVQVHPNDEDARKDMDTANNKVNGKNECWFILDTEEKANIIWGWKDHISIEEFNNGIKEKKLEQKLRFVSVKKGDFIYVPAGTVHAIGGGIKLLEVQQSSDITYRIYDYHRDRELHIKKAIHVCDFSNQKPIIFKNFHHSFCTKNFTVQKFCINDEKEKNIECLEKNNWVMIFSLNHTLHLTQGKQKTTLNAQEAAIVTKPPEGKWFKNICSIGKKKENHPPKPSEKTANYILVSE